MKNTTKGKRIDKKIIITHYFMEKSKKDGRKDFTNKKLQKLLYYAQVWSLVLNKKRLINDKFEAWIHGAAIPSLYRRYKVFQFNEIAEDYQDNEFNQLSDEDKNLLNEIWRVYGKYDGDYLELLNHSEEPWQKARQNTSPFKSSKAIISESEMRRYYGEKLKKEKEKSRT